MPTFSVGATGRDYPTVQAAWNALPSTLAADYVFELYNDAEITGTLDTSASSKTFAGYSLTIRPATGHGFRDHANKATNALRYNQSNGVAWDATAFITTGVLLFTSGTIIVLDGLQIKHSSYRAVQATAGTITIKNCLIECNYNNYAVMMAGTAINNVVIQKNNAGSGILTDNTSTTRNNTVVYIGSGSSSGEGIGSQYVPHTAIGNAVFGFATAFATGSGGTFHSSSDYNATNLSSTGTGTGTHNLTSLTFASQFESVGTAGSEDLRLKSGNSLAGAGVADASITPDILNQNRASPPAIGAVDAISSPPSAPSGVTVSNVTASTASILWTDNSSNETGFKVRYAPSPYSSWTTATGSVAASPYIVTGLTDGTSYKAGVAAFNGSGDSSWIESGVFTTTVLSKLRPNTDTSAGSWSASSGSVLYSMIDETSADDADYITSTSATTCKIKFETSTDPADNSNHSLRIRARSTSGTLTVKLVQGDPAETTIVSWAPTLTSSFANYQYDLSTAEASVITDYSALYLKLTTS